MHLPSKELAVCKFNTAQPPNFEGISYRLEISRPLTYHSAQQNVETKHVAQ